MSASTAIGVGLGRDGVLVLRYVDAATPIAHHQAVVTALRDGPMAPLRFGSTMTKTEIAAQGETIHSVIALSTDHIEIGLRCTPLHAVGDAVGGRDWLRRAAGRRHASEALAERLATIPGVAMIRDLGADASTRRIALCVVRADAEAVVAAVSVATEGYAAEVSGPWPLYSFTPAGSRP
jgi:hypothetical protein